MSRYIGQYVSTCDLCLRTKPTRQALVGELHPLRIPDSRWDMLSIDFVVELPPSSGHDAVMTVVDSVSKRVHFIPTHMTVTAEGAARLFLYQVWKLHGLPKCVVSDCRPQFVARFTKELYCLLGIKLASSTAWHPQTDRQIAHQPRVGPVPPALCEREARRLVQPLTYGGERGKRDVDCDKQVEKAVTAPNCVLKGSWGEGGSGGIRKKLKSEYTAYLESKYGRNDGSSI